MQKTTRTLAIAAVALAGVFSVGWAAETLETSTLTEHIVSGQKRDVS